MGGGGGCGLHESQSRFFENVIGRSEAFWKPIYGKLQDTFPEAYGSLPLEGFLQEINRAQASLIRTEADELTYSLHILVRYELEKELMEGTVQKGRCVSGTGCSVAAERKNQLDKTATERVT